MRACVEKLTVGIVYTIDFLGVSMKSFKDYAIYFVTLILGVCIFYLFNSMDSQTAILEVTSRQSEMIDLYHFTVECCNDFIPKQYYNIDIICRRRLY